MGIHWFTEGKHTDMKLKKIFAAALLFALLGGILGASPACAAGADALDDVLSPLLGGGLGELADWLEDKARGVAPELRETLRAELAPHSLPREALWLDRLPLLRSGKPDLAALRHRCAGEGGTMGSRRSSAE